MSEFKSKSSDKKWIWGRHSIEALLETHPEWVLELVYEQKSNNDDLVDMANEHGVSVLESARVPKDLQKKRHQGIVAKIKRFAFEYFNQQEETLVSWVKEGGVFAALDRVQDPQNYGAIIRSAAGMGVKAILVPQKHQCPLTGAVAQASAGNLFRVPIILCPSLTKSVEFLKAQGSEIRVMQMGGQDIASLEEARTSCTWVMGSEGEGVRDELLSLADKKVSIPLSKEVESLNVSASAAIAFFVSRR